MKDKAIEEELKKRSPPSYRVSKDPVTGNETWEEDRTAVSFSYTSEEFEKWVKLGGIPGDLAQFASKEFEEAVKKIRASKEMAERAKNENRELTPEDWLELAKSYPTNLEDVGKASELIQFVLKNREVLLKLLKQPVPKTRKIRHAGHFVDQKLKYSTLDKQPSLFDMVSAETKEKMAVRNVEIRTEGIRLSPPQDKLMNALMRLLHEKSENKNEKSEQFYSGNEESQLVPYGGSGQKSKSAVLRLSPAELYKAYLDSEDYSGDEIKFIKSVLHDTEQQKFLIIYERKYEIVGEKGRKEKRRDRIEAFQSLFKIISFFEGLTEEERKGLDQGDERIRESRGELIIAINPLLTDQINSKYVEYPEDINRRTVIAAGGHRLVTESIIALRDYMLREISAGRKTSEINEEKLVFLLKLDNYVKSNRKSRIQDRIKSAIQSVKNLGLIKDYEKIIGASGQWKYVFGLNPDFE